MTAGITRAAVRARSGPAIALAMGAALLIGGCGSLGQEDDDYTEGTVHQLYSRAYDLMQEKDYAEAAKLFGEVDRQHPYSAWAPRSQLMVAYANYLARDFETARLSLDRFLRLNPAHRDVPYAHYLKALCFFEEVRDTKRDPGPTFAAYSEFTLIAERFPTTKYAEDSRRKAAVLRDHLAGHEMEVGRFYQAKDQHLAAINRFKRIVQEFQRSRHVAEALHRMTESYVALGLRDEAGRAAALLGRNFPDSPWRADSAAILEGKRTSPLGSAPEPKAPAGGKADGKASGQAGGTAAKPAAGEQPEATAESGKKSWLGRLFDRIF